MLHLCHGDLSVCTDVLHLARARKALPCSRARLLRIVYLDRQSSSIMLLQVSTDHKA